MTNISPRLTVVGSEKQVLVSKGRVLPQGTVPAPPLAGKQPDGTPVLSPVAKLPKFPGRKL